MASPSSRIIDRIYQSNFDGILRSDAQEPQRWPSCIEVFRIADLLVQREVRRLQGAAKGNFSLQRGSVASFASSRQASGPRPTADSFCEGRSPAAVDELNFWPAIGSFRWHAVDNTPAARLRLVHGSCVDQS